MPTFRPGKPHWRLGLTTPLVLTGATQPIAWQIAHTQDPAVWNVGSPIDVAPVVGGLYLLRAFIARSTTTGAFRPFVWIRINGANVAFGNGAVTANAESCEVTTLRQISDGDVLSVTCFPGTALGSIASVGTTFEGARVGPVRWTG